MAMKRVVENTYRLKHPLTLDSGTVIDQVDIVRPKGKDRRVIDRHITPEGGLINPMAMQLEMIERLCRMPDGGDVFSGFADELDDEDVEELGKLVTPDLPSGQATGGTPSAS